MNERHGLHSLPRHGKDCGDDDGYVSVVDYDTHIGLGAHEYGAPLLTPPQARFIAKLLTEAADRVEQGGDA